jgi:hypothetical protein
MFKLVVAVRTFRVNILYVQIDVEDGTGLVQVILWREEKECTTLRQMIHECNSNCYIRVIGEVKDYHGVHEIPATATSSLRAPIELPEIFQRAFSS